MVRAFAHGAMGRLIDPSRGWSIELFLVTIYGVIAGISVGHNKVR